MALSLRTPTALGLSARVHMPRVAARPAFAPTVARRPVISVRAAAADEKKEKAPKKKIPQPVKRVMIARENRLYNKSRKSACWTRMKKVINLSNKMVASSTKAEDEEVAAIEKLVAEAYKEIDKAVSKGVLHLNTASRRKMRVAKYKRLATIAAGLWKPPADHQDFNKYQRIAARKKLAQ